MHKSSTSLFYFECNSTERINYTRPLKTPMVFKSLKTLEANSRKRLKRQKITRGFEELAEKQFCPLNVTIKKMCKATNTWKSKTSKSKASLISAHFEFPEDLEDFFNSGCHKREDQNVPVNEYQDKNFHTENCENEQNLHSSDERKQGTNNPTIHRAGRLLFSAMGNITTSQVQKRICVPETPLIPKTSLDGKSILNLPETPCVNRSPSIVTRKQDGSILMVQETPLFQANLSQPDNTVLASKKSGERKGIRKVPETPLQMGLREAKKLNQKCFVTSTNQEVRMVPETPLLNAQGFPPDLPGVQEVKAPVMQYEKFSPIYEKLQMEDPENPLPFSFTVP
ncbi:uncharacterized protein LOC116604132 [Nematostella vectensis]|uniref:uncharacterized protein LOC116604132 n=1 Tax=Nematostella vectensis TaxID=45351 RepID=UPI00138FBD88|nr:uncharacterized protein LOC116604132 [Nematostella vectensis]